MAANMKKIVKNTVKNTAKNSIKKAQNGMSTAAKRAASIASQNKNEMRDFKIEYAALNNPSDAIKADRTKKRDDVIYREPFGESPTKIKGSWKDNTTSIYETSNPSKVGLVKKPNIEKRRTAGEKKIMGVLEKGKKADGTMKEGAQRKIASIRAKERAGVQKLENKAARVENKANRVEKRAAIGEAKANVKAVKKSFKK